VNALAGLESIPASMLVKPKIEVLMMPLGTSAEGLDPATAQTDPERTSQTLAVLPPVRINFEGAGAVAVPAEEPKPAGAAQ
jgi:hypothetical protein